MMQVFLAENIGSSPGKIAAVFADDRGGRPEFKWPNAVIRVRELLTQQAKK
jgi:hypothetical protein